MIKIKLEIKTLEMYKVVMFSEFKYKIKNLEEMKIFAKFISTKIKRNSKFIIFLKGNLGSGKTTFTRLLLNNFGISDKEFEGSPTFTIINEYPHNIFHIDLYRLVDKDELEYTGIYYYLSNMGLFIVEWPEILDISPNMLMRFEITKDSRRKVYVHR